MADQPTSQPSQNLQDQGHGLSAPQLLIDAAASYAQHQAQVQQGTVTNPGDKPLGS
jgi:hypothetical protein